MNTVELHIQGRVRRFSGPSSWAELSPHQAVGVVRLRAGVADKPQLLFAGLLLLYGMKPRHQRWLFDERFLARKGYDPETIQDILPYGQDLLDTLLWIGEADPVASFPVRSFRRFDFQYGSPRILLRRLLDRKRYYGPTAGLMEISFGEFMFADRAFQAGDRAQLAAILYRKKGEVFDKRTAEDRAHLFATLDPALLSLIEQNFSDTLRLLHRYFRRVFKPATQQTDAQTKALDKKGGSWLDVAINLVKLDPTKVAEVETLDLYLALKVLDEQIRQADEMEAELEKRR